MLMINMSSIWTSNLAAGGSRAGRSEPGSSLHMNQVLSAQVVRQISNGVELQAGDRHFQAKTQLPLETGQRLELQVVSLGAQVELKLLKNLGTGSGDLLSLYRPWELAESIRRLIAQPSENRILSREIWLQVSRLLNRFEHSPGDLQGRDVQAWASLARRFFRGGLGKAPDSSGWTALIAFDSSERQLSALQLCQERLVECGQQLLPLPLPFIEQGYVLLSEEPSRQEHFPEETLLSVHLELKRLGSVRIDVLSVNEMLRLHFLCSNPETTELIRVHSGLLQEGPLASLCKDARFATVGDHPVHSLLGKVLPAGEGILRVKA